MSNAQVVAAVVGVVAACRGSSPQPAAPVTSATPIATTATTTTTTTVVVEAEPVEHERESERQRQLARQQAIQQARDAGIIGGTAVPPGSRAPTVSIGTPASSSRDKASIRAVVRMDIHRFAACYEQALVSQPGLTGTTLVSFVIAADGRVVSATATGLDPGVDTCCATVMQSLTFPPGPGVTKVNYPFTFRPAPDQDGDGK